jgi:hypothetical protein
MKRSHWAWGVIAALALGLTTAAYLQPAVMIQLSEQIWSCFG